MKRAVTMPATKAKSKQKRTLLISKKLRKKLDKLSAEYMKPAQCESCYKKCQELLDLACKLERAEFERDVMVGVLGAEPGAGQYRHSPQS